MILSASLFETIEGLAKFQSLNSPSVPLNKLSKGKQEEYLVALSKAVLQAVGGESRRAASSEPAKGKQIFDLPLTRNRFFTGRGEILKQLREAFLSGESVQALNGLGGMGKTQTALEYAYRHRGDYQVVLWGNANSRESLATDFAEMAGLLNLPERSAQDQSEAASAVKQWLQSNRGWLLILDNADEISIAREFIPSSETGHVLLTTRAHSLGDIGERNELEKLNPSEGAQFLLRRMKKLKKDQPLESVPEELHKQAETLSKVVDGLPLALDQGAAFIEETQSTLEKYLNLFQCERSDLLARRGELAIDHPSVAVTFSLAFRKVEEASPAAADLLRLCAFLEVDEIPEEIFSVGATELGDVLSAVAVKSLSLTKVIAEAGRFSLVQRNPETDTLSLHRLVQAVLRDEMDGETRRVWAERAIRAVNKAFPVYDHSNWPLCSRLIPHTRLLASLIDDQSFDFPEAASLMNQAGEYLDERAQYFEAEPLYKRALAIRRETLGAEHSDTTQSLHNLAVLYKNQGRYSEAESLYKQALATREKVLEAEHPDTAKSLYGLAVLYKNQGKYAEAEPLYKRALAIREKMLGAEHPDVARSLNNLAVLYKNQGRYAEAQLLSERALAIKEKALGAEHPDTAHSLHCLAGVYYKQGKHLEAELLLKRALAIREKTLGIGHPDTAQSLNNIAMLYDKQGKHADAESLLMQVVILKENALGAMHPYVAYSLYCLAKLYDNQERYAEAESLYRRVLAIREKALGIEHPDVATSLNDLARLYTNQGKYLVAEPLYQRSLSILEEKFGVEHPFTTGVLKNYADLLRAMNQSNEAERFELQITQDPEDSG